MSRLKINHGAVLFLCTLKSAYQSEWMCGFQAFYLNVSFTANMWLNAMIAFQIHRILRFSNVRRRYMPPTKRQVVTQAGLVYACTIFWGFLCAFNPPFLPRSTHLWAGFVSMPMEYDLASTLFFFLVCIPLAMTGPMMHFFHVAMDIYRNNPLPPLGGDERWSFCARLATFSVSFCFQKAQTGLAGWQILSRDNPGPRIQP